MPTSLRMCLRRFNWLKLSGPDDQELALSIRTHAARVSTTSQSHTTNGKQPNHSVFIKATPHQQQRSQCAAKKAIYISYSHQDTAKVLPLWRELEAEGLDCWIDILQRQSGGSNWREETSAAISECTLMLCCCTHGSASSAFCQEEWQMGVDSGKQLVVVYFDTPCEDGVPSVPSASCVIQGADQEQSIVQLVTELRYQLATAVPTRVKSSGRQHHEQQVSTLFGAIAGGCWDELSALLKQLCVPEVRAHVGSDMSVGLEATQAALRKAFGTPGFSLHVLSVQQLGGTDAQPQLQVLWELSKVPQEPRPHSSLQLEERELAFDGISTCVFTQDQMLGEVRVYIHASDEDRRQRSNSATADISWVRGNLLGAGAFGNVYAGLVVGTNELVAVKEIKVVGSSEQDTKFAQSLQNEVSVLARLGVHPNIVRYNGAQLQQLDASRQKTLYIFLEYVGGGSIAHMIQKFGRLRLDTVTDYTRQILHGVEFLHSHGVSHRDIKGANILVALDGTLKLSDFGCSDMGFQADGSTALAGTPFWMAPEVVRGEGYGRPSDIWSVGCTVIEMCTGDPPWSQLTNPFTTMYKIGHSKSAPEFPPGIGQHATQFLQACFTQEVENRPTASDLLSNCLLYTSPSPRDS
eukprot:TRINITY_DN60216_c0_g1_i2.p1 TRINITY_DN60216_c0_g1~~TRINITY_DN60216_c0_g1_i2.p1  ORF type:complete len:635 (-),score=137.14 TRINITY_DN60216_c0_g1_i2:117-2021(-)